MRREVFLHSAVHHEQGDETDVLLSVVAVDALVVCLITGEGACRMNDECGLNKLKHTRYDLVP